MPMWVGVFAPPNWNRRYVEVFGSTIEEVYLQGMQSFESKMRAAGLPLEELPGAPPLPISLTPEERVERALTMLQAGFIGEKTGPPSRDPHKGELLIHLIRRSD